MVAMATNSNITVPQKYTAKYKNVGYGWDTSHPTTISKKFIILIYHYLHAVPTIREFVRRELMSIRWIEKEWQDFRALRFRQGGHEDETPAAFLARKQPAHAVTFINEHGHIFPKNH